MLLSSGPNLVDPRGRLLPRSYDILGNSFTVLIRPYYQIWLALPFGLSVLNLSVFPFAGLYTTFIFQKVDPDIVPPLTSPFIIKDASHTYEEASVSAS